MAKVNHPAFHRNAHGDGMGHVMPTKPGQKPITYKKGGLHQSLGVPQGQPIPKSKLRAAKAGKYGPKAEKEANLAINVFHVKTT